MYLTDRSSGVLLRAIKTCFIALGLLFLAESALAAPCDLKGGSPPPFIEHDLTSNVSTSTSYCELCGYGYVTILVNNPYSGASMINMSVTEDLGSSGLVYDPAAPNPIRYTINGSPVAGPAPSGSGSVLTFNLAGITLDSSPGFGGNNDTLAIRFAVRRDSALSEEGLVSANRTIQASLTYSTNQSCSVSPQTTGPDVLPLREPMPNIVKRGRNVDAAQSSGQYSSTVYGNIDDDVIWRIEIGNGGLAGMQDVKFDDLMSGTNFQINYACPTEGEASAIAAADGVGPVGNCISASNTISNFLVDAPFGAMATSPDGHEVDATAGGTTYVYLVGKILNSCDANSTNTVSNFEWGCEADAPDGGITATSSGASPGNATATLSSRVVNSGLNIQRQFTGTNTAQPAGSKGLVTITIRNNTGGTVKNIHLRDVLPPQYVVDSTFDPTLTVTPAYGAYDGMIDTITWTNPAANTYPLSSTDPTEPLSNVAPEFDLTSSTVHPDHADQFNMLRRGDRAVIRFRVVLVPATGYAPYDLAANLDVRTENTGDNTDPNNATTITNQLYVTFEQFCNPGVTQQPSQYPYSDNFPVDPEDIDVDITGTELIFILTNDPSNPLPLQVALTNNGGDDATDYYAYVTFGATMDVVSAPAGCSVTTNPPLLEVWDNPADIPATATVYECNSTGVGTIAPGQTRLLDFQVIKTSDAARLALDDLSFRADVVGEVTLSDGTPLWFPTPDTSVINNRANNYTLDGVRARVIGFNLTKTQSGTCSENNPPTATPDSLVQIGEECTYSINTGGWFGFQTPGFTYIAVQAITVTDQLPNGQGYVSSTDPYLTSDPTIKSITLTPQTNPPLQPLDEGWIDWSFNQDVVNERITVRDQWFNVDVTTRVLNDPVDSSAAPNQHAALSTNVLNSIFQAVFYNDVLGAEEVFNLGQGTIGYPQESVRRVDLTVTEPDISVVKEVCNETLYGTGTGCSNFVTLADDGDTQDSYIYRITLTNQASASGTVRAPAYDITSTDTLDASDLVYVVPFSADGLDNDGDGLIDGADTDGEGSISDNVVNNAVVPVITYSHTHSNALLRLDPGASVTFYYRVDPDDAVAPLQSLVNSVYVTYDSLAGDFGNQTVVQSANSTIGGARVYTSANAFATAQMLPLLTQPKSIIALSNTPLTGSQPQPVSVGEEIEYQLRASIPVANLRDFYISDTLPAGISCKEAPVVDLDAAPYSDAGFSPGGQITPTCTGNLVYWNFGNQELTTAPDATARFEFDVRFIARVDNTAATNDGVTISNGYPATTTLLHYRDETNADIWLNYDQHDIIVREPSINLSKSYEVASMDGGDVITVTVTAQNNGTAPGYNLRILDDLTGTDLTYLGNVSGADPPDSIDTSTFGANQPVFVWNSIDVGATFTFSFEVRVDTAAQPLEVLDNTIQADWTSLPSQATALNSSGSIGADGATAGMRIGALPNAGDSINDYEATASASGTVPAVTMTKSDLNPAIAAEIGAHKHFQIEIALPEGTTNNLVATDHLNFGGQSYVLSNNTNFDVTYTFQNIATINGQPPAEAAFNSYPVDGTSGTAAWDIGTVVTATEDDTTAGAVVPLIRIDYYARINNDVGTDVGDTLQNSVDVTYRNGETAAVETVNDATAPISAVEAALTVTKTVTPTTPVAGGDILEYTISVNNAGNATAYDVNIVDTMPASVTFYSPFTPTAEINSIAVTGFTATPAGAPSGPLTWGRGNSDDSLDIPAGGTLVLVYQVQLVGGVEANGSFINSVLVDWTSLDGASDYERDGAGCPTITPPDDYCTGPATVSSTVADTNSLVKSIVADTYSDAFSTATDAVARVGDLVTYRLELNLQEGLTRNVLVRDALPAGLAFYDIVSINGDTAADYTAPATGAGSNFSYAAVTPASLPASGQTGTLSFNLGDVSNDPSGDPTTDTLVIEYRAQVEPDVLAQTASTTLTNTATLTYVDSGGILVVDPTRLESSATLTVRQPVIGSITKSDRSGRTSTATISVATDVMNFRLEACNASGTAPAYGVLISDVLASQLDEGSIAGPNNGAGQPDVYINGVLSTPVADYTYTPPAIRGGTMAFRLITPVNPGGCVQIDYDIGFHTDFGANQTWSNGVTLDEYWSLPPNSAQQYAPLGPAIFSMTNGPVTFDPPVKAVDTPAGTEVTIGDEVIYHISVPGNVPNAAIYDVVVTDTLDASLEYLSAEDVSGNSIPITDNTTGNNVNLTIAQIPAGQQAVIALHARVANNASANAGVSFSNTANYTYATSAGGATINAGNGTTAGTLTIVEPQLGIAKSATNISNPGNAPVAGDILRYTLTMPASGGAIGDNYSDAFDLDLIDNLSLGLAYQPGSATVDGAGNSIADPTIIGDGVTTAQTLSWNPSDATAAIRVVEGTTVTVTYDVLVLDSVQANQDLANSATVRWTGIDGNSVYERNGSGTPTENDYVAGPETVTLTTPDNSGIVKTRLTDTYGAGDADVRVGDIIEYELRLTLNEGTTSNVVVTDTLPQGLGFEQIVSVNGDTTVPYSASVPFVYSDLSAPVIGGNPSTGPSTVTWNVGDIVDVPDNNAANDEFVIVYRVRVLDNALVQAGTTVLTNDAAFSYDSATGATTVNSGAPVNVLQPLLTVAKSAVTGGGDTVLDAGEVVTYTVDITNGGAAPAYDPVLVDTIPQGLRNGAATITMVSTTLVNAAVILPDVAPSYDPVTGVATWNFDTGAADAYTIAPGETLRIVYQVQADADLGPGLTLTNQALVQSYYSFDNDAVPTLGGISGTAEVYGPSNTATVTLTTASPGALDKQNTVTTASIGEEFRYRIVVPAAPQTTALHDVRILDDLTASAAKLSFVSVSKISGSLPWVPVNTGTATDLVIEDTTNGIDIPAGEQIEIEITVVLNDDPINIAGLTFNNTATYTFNQFDGDDLTRTVGVGDTTADMTIVAPDNLTLEKSGPALMRVGVPGTFTLNVHNTGTASAYDATITDIIPNPVPGGMCDAPPSNITAQMYLADGVTTSGPVLVENTDYTVNFVAGTPSCTLTVTMLTPAAAIPADHRLIVRYDASLDTDSPNNVSLTNIAGVTEWFSGDTAGAGATGQIHTYTRTITNGTVGTLDYEDAYTVVTESPVILFQKYVTNVTPPVQDPGTDAAPGDILRYRIVATNVSPVDVPVFSIVDAVDDLNAPAVFVPGSLNVISVPGADVSNTDPNGGAKGTGLLDVRNLSLDAQGGANDSVTIVFEVTLASAINSGTVVLNQAQSQIYNLPLQPSDDPNVNGADDPNVLGDEDPTQTLITSAPMFQVYKTSQDITGSPTELLPGETLRYTITVKNIGNEDAINATLRDQIPTYTTYISGTTTLNGTAVADPAPGVSAIEGGMSINSPRDSTAGHMPADATAAVDNVATITFNVMVDADAINGTIISNQGYVNGDGAGSSGPVPQQPSDDPATAVPDDPTRNVVGNLPLVDALKTVTLIDTSPTGTPGIVDPDDTLRYTITITNFGAVAATGVTLTDAIPADTSYVPNSTYLNALPVGQPDGGVSPLIAGIPISSPPMPVVGNLPPGASAVVTFDVTVDSATPPGTLISNQGFVDSNEQPVEPTDADGLDSNGDQPTVIAVGNAQQLTISKTVSVVGGGPAIAGGQLEYVVRVTNVGTVPATDVLINDDLDVPVAGQKTFISGSATLNGQIAGINYAAPLITADYGNTFGALPPGQVVELRFRVSLDSALALGDTVTNTAQAYWNAMTQTASASVSLDIGAMPGVANLNGRVWHDVNFDDTFDSTERALENWNVEIYFKGALLDTVSTDASGEYHVNGLAPNAYGTDRYELRFVAPGAGSNTAKLGRAVSAFTNGLQYISDIIVYAGTNLQDLNLPIDPDGVVYNSIVRVPVVGAMVTMLRASNSAPLPSTCFDDPGQQNQVTLADGFYKFDINFNQPECPNGDNYRIQVTPPPSGYVAGESVAIPPATNAGTLPFSVPNCLGGVDDAVPATANYCEIQTFSAPPPLAIAPASAGTKYHLHLTLDNGQIPGESQLFNNNIPLDPNLGQAVTISKTAERVNVSRGGFVPYTISVKNTLPVPLTDVSILDDFPAGFKYVEGSARVNGDSIEPTVNGLELRWDVPSIDVGESYTIKLLLIVGAGVAEGEYVNRAHVYSNLTASNASGEAGATVRVVPDPTMDCSDIIGKVFDDANLNGYQDEGESGIAGVRLATARGLLVTTDEHGRFHVTCAAVPNEQRGSNFILKLDERTLPSGYRVTTENPRVERLTRGKMARFDFGATIHHVVSLSAADGAFQPDSTEIRPQWIPRLSVLITQLRKRPSVLRITYLADVEPVALVDARVAKLKETVLEYWRKVSSDDLSIETEVFWRHGGAVDADRLSSGGANALDYVTGVVDRSSIGDNTERQLPYGYTYTPWVQDDSIYHDANEPVYETKMVTEKTFTTKKLMNVVPPIPFGSGKADIPDEFVAKLREVLAGMRDRVNVRLHFVGHSDNLKLRGTLKDTYGDNLGLSKERAGATAEFFQRALELPPEAISYEGVGDAQPIASNDTAAGRARNRRVEVQVWYDEVSEKEVERKVKVDQDVKRIMVCRVETVCKLRYKEGHSRRAKLKNLVPPLHFDEGVSNIPEQYLRQLRQALRNLADKSNVQMRFIGYTDNMPLTGRNARIYGDHLGLSKANARRVALAVQEALRLTNKSVDSTGKGAEQPVASNNSAKGRALNRRVEVEFWYDDPLENLPDEPQICPEAAAAETVERIYNPPEGDIKPIFFENGQPLVPDGYVERLRDAMNDLGDKTNVRLRFIGYASNKRLDRRTAMVYGDDVGLSTARARRTMMAVQEMMNLTDKQVEFEGRGYVQSQDVVNAGFVELDRSKVEVQVVYDELAVLDENEGVTIERLTRDVETKNPYALNLMRISVDGQPVNDPNKSIPDVERCTDVALDRAQVQFKFDDLQSKPRLNVTAWPDIISHADNADTEFAENTTHFKTYTNYPSFIDKAEIRLFRADQSTRDTPIEVVPIDNHGEAQWSFSLDNYVAPRMEIKYVLRVYDGQGNFDETTEQTLWVVDALDASARDHDDQKRLLVGYGENRLAVNNIPLNGGTVRVHGADVPAGYKVWFAGYDLPVSRSGAFGGEFILPTGSHTVEVAITDDAGNGNVYQRRLTLDDSDWFYVGIGDLTASRDRTNGPAEEVTGDNNHYGNDISIDGRLAFYIKGKLDNESKLTASADTREGPVNELFSNFMNKSPEALFRRIDPDYFYPTFGDDSTVEQDAPTSGKFYLKWQKDRNYGLWGNFDLSYLDNDLAHVDRGLYGANLNYEGESATTFGETRFAVNLFGAEPGTLPARDEFLGTAGSLYYLRHQDILTGSERVRIEIRDAVSGLVVEVKNLTQGLDYDIDYIQGRIMLTEPLSASAASGVFVDSRDYGGNDVYLVTRYEYTPGFDDLHDVTTGGRVHYWFNDHVKLGVTAEDQGNTGADTGLKAFDLTFRKNAGTWLKLAKSTSHGPVSSTWSSSDGGYSFDEYALSSGTDINARGQRVDASVRLEDVFDGVRGTLTLFNQRLDAGYSAPGLIALTDTTQTGAVLQMPVHKSVNVKLKYDSNVQEDALQSKAVEGDVDYLLTENWSLGVGLRHDSRIDASTSVPLTQQQGDRSDLSFRAGYDSRKNWLGYGFLQGTTHVSGNRDRNGRLGVGGDYRVSDRFKLDGELSSGALGAGIRLGTDYKVTDATDLYSSYVLENERTDNGVKARKGNLATGFKSRYSDSASIYMEERYVHGDIPTGLTHAMGIDLAVTDNLNFGADIDAGTLRDNNTGAETKRTAFGIKVGYKFASLTYAGALEYRVDKTQQPDTTFADRTTWLTKNSVKYQTNPDWRFLGKLNLSRSDSSLGDFYDGDFTEAVLAYAYRPVSNDALNALFKYTYFYNMPTADQVTLSGTAAQYIQKSHILSVDLMYDVTRNWTLGGKYAHRFGQLSLDRQDPQFFDSDASLYILRADWHITRRWDALLEGRQLAVQQAGDRRSGALLAVYRHFDEHVKAGIGYNFTDFSDDLTDLDYRSQGLFINVLGKF